MRAIPDSRPIIHLSWIDHLDLLTAVFEEVVVAPAVRAEVLDAAAGTRGLEQIRRFLGGATVRVQSPVVPSDPAHVLPPSLGAGETEAIYLAEGTDAAVLVSDDATARSVAKRRGIAVTGTVGVLKIARDDGLIPAALPLALELRRLGQWLEESLITDLEREERGS